MRPDLIERARQVMRQRLLAEAPYAGRAGEVAVVLCGSAVTEYADAYSGLDFLVLGPGEDPTPVAAPAPAEFRARRYRVIARGLAALRRDLAAADDETLFLVHHGVVLHDPRGEAEPLWSDPPSPGRPVWDVKAVAAVRELRRRRASLAWALRRGQPYAVLDGLSRLLGQALRICFYLEGLPPPPAKWLHGAALRTAAGREIRLPLLDLLSSLGDTATLGGSLHLGSNRLYQRCARLEDEVVAALRRRGLNPLRPERGGRPVGAGPGPAPASGAG